MAFSLPATNGEEYVFRIWEKDQIKKVYVILIKDNKLEIHTKEKIVKIE